MRKLMTYVLSFFVLILPIATKKVTVLKHNVGLLDLLLFSIFILYFLNLLVKKDSRNRFKKGFIDFFRDPLTIFSFLLVILMFVSSSYAMDKKLAFTESIRFATYIILYFIIKNEFDYKDSKRMLLSYITSITLVSVFGIIQFFTKIGLNPKYIVNYGHGSIVRIHSSFQNPNALGAFLILGIFPIFMMAMGIKRKRLIWILTFLLVLLAIILTGSRNALVAFGVGMLILVISYNFKLILGFILALVAAFMVPEVRYRLLDLFSKTQNESRIKLWKTAIAMIKEHPLRGIGNGNYTVRYDEYVKKYPSLKYPDYHNMPSHNSYLKIQSELGIGGIISFLGLLIFSIFKIKKLINRTRDRFIKSFYTGFLASMIAFLFMNFSDNMFFIPEIAMSYWIIVALCDNISYNDLV
ncbi:O-antigen ligase family protein [Haloimpatiens sp. FM7315]|uniref:O-antigen ligase family protein n=1 Tax=Haloimpatiens sp. FM7315 TaxID=3298609 RepID=UPI00370ADE32